MEVFSAKSGAAARSEWSHWNRPPARVTVRVARATATTACRHSDRDNIRKVFHGTPARMFPQQLRIAQKKIFIPCCSPYSAIPVPYTLYSPIPFWIIWWLIIFAHLTFCLEKIVRAVKIRKLLGILDHHQISSVYENARSVLHVAASRKNSQLGRLPEVLFRYRQHFVRQQTCVRCPTR